jgi:hypothetical protein
MSDGFETEEALNGLALIMLPSFGSTAPKTPQLLNPYERKPVMLGSQVPGALVYVKPRFRLGQTQILLFEIYGAIIGAGVLGVTWSLNSHSPPQINPNAFL